MPDLEFRLQTARKNGIVVWIEVTKITHLPDDDASLGGAVGPMTVDTSEGRSLPSLSRGQVESRTKLSSALKKLVAGFHAPGERIRVAVFGQTSLDALEQTLGLDRDPDKLVILPLAKR